MFQYLILVKKTFSFLKKEKISGRAACVDFTFFHFWSSEVSDNDLQKNIMLHYISKKLYFSFLAIMFHFTKCLMFCRSG